MSDNTWLALRYAEKKSILFAINPSVFSCNILDRSKHNIYQQSIYLRITDTTSSSSSTVASETTTAATAAASSTAIVGESTVSTTGALATLVGVTHGGTSTATSTTATSTTVVATTVHAVSLGLLAVLAASGLVGEAFLLEELLLADGEDEGVAAVYAAKVLVLELGVDVAVEPLILRLDILFLLLHFAGFLLHFARLACLAQCTLTLRLNSDDNFFRSID